MSFTFLNSQNRKSQGGFQLKKKNILKVIIVICGVIIIIVVWRSLFSLVIFAFMHLSVVFIQSDSHYI